MRGAAGSMIFYASRLIIYTLAFEQVATDRIALGWAT